ncbi:hypothetical protein FCM35_KLT09757 [Carex littledalei]|uniref:Uncharacterized protein n=1 Tax=Carex littledalei TaxID=544730 RepID=A0A833RUE8_9POAL|nr:hypothetical protein FCM35_KLT09757 [Carex littledalei]
MIRLLVPRRWQGTGQKTGKVTGNKGQKAKAEATRAKCEKAKVVANTSQHKSLTIREHKSLTSIHNTDNEQLVRKAYMDYSSEPAQPLVSEKATESLINRLNLDILNLIRYPWERPSPLFLLSWTYATSFLFAEPSIPSIQVMLSNAAQPNEVVQQ